MSGSNSSAPAAVPAPPPDPAALTVHDGPAPVLTSEGDRRRGRLTALLVLLACAAPIVASYFMYYVVRPAARTNYAELIQPSVALPAGLVLHDLQGRPVPASDLKGQWLLTVVAGGACDATCETLLYAQHQLRQMTGREADRIDRVWLVNDDAPVRESIARAMQGDGGWVLRMPPGQLWLRPQPGHGVGEHLYVIDPHGQWMMRTPVPLEPSRFKKDLDRLLRASAFWDRPGRTP